jgi:Short C-terminal domain
VTADALAALPRRARRQLPPEDSIRAAFTCRVDDRDAVLVLTDAQVVVVGQGGWFYDDAPLTSAWLSHVGELVCDLRLWNAHRRVQFRTPEDIHAAVGEFCRVADGAGLQSGRPAPLGPDERAVPRCVYLGGVNVPVPVGAEVDLLFGSAGIDVHHSPPARGRGPIAQLTYAAQFSVELSGPGRFTTGGGFAGGGIGLEGAAAGMAVAAVLNALSTRTRVESVIAVLSADYEGFFLCREHDLDELRRLLAPVFVRARQITGGPVDPEATPSAGGGADLVATLERLTALHQAGALTEEEFRRAKAQALGSVVP